MYQRTFYEICENERQVENWLKKYGGVEGEDYRIEFRSLYYVAGGWDQSDVLTVGNILVEIYNPMIAFQFELLKAGGCLRDRIELTYEELELEYEYMCDHQKDDKPVFLDKYPL